MPEIRARKPTFGQLTSMNYRQHPRYKGTTMHILCAENGGLRIRDISGNGFDGIATSNGGTPYTAANLWQRGQWGPAIEAGDGLGEKSILCGDVPLVFPSKDSWSVSLWFKATTWTSLALADRLFAARHDVNFSQFFITLSTNDLLQYFYSDGIGGNTVTIKSGLSTGTWYHCGLSYDGTQFLPTFNGIIGTATVDTLIALTNTQKVALGGHWNSSISMSAFEMDGLLDEVRVWNRVLGPSEWWSLYTQPFLEFEEEEEIWLPETVVAIPDLSPVDQLRQSGGMIGGSWE